MDKLRAMAAFVRIVDGGSLTAAADALGTSPTSVVRTLAALEAALGVRREVAERCLGHKLRGVEGTYDRHDYFRERRAALEQWTLLVTQAERGERKVIPMRAGAK